MGRRDVYFSCCVIAHSRSYIQKYKQVTQAHAVFFNLNKTECVRKVRCVSVEVFMRGVHKRPRAGLASQQHGGSYRSSPIAPATHTVPSYHLCEGPEGPCVWFGMGELSFKFKAPGAITVEADTEMCPSHAVSVYPGIRGSTTLDENSRVHTSPSPEMTNVSTVLYVWSTSTWSCSTAPPLWHPADGWRRWLDPKS